MSDRPTEDVLRMLYESERMTTYEIASRYNVNRVSVGRWLKKAGIALRPSGNGLANRGLVAPGKVHLHRMIHIDYLTYEQIATTFGVDQSAVQHWLIRHGIAGPSKLRRLPDPSELRDLYDSGLSMVEIGSQCKVSSKTVREAFRRAGIEPRPDGFDGGVRYRCNDGHMVRSTYERRVDDWLSGLNVPHQLEPALPFGKCRGDFLANGWYIEVWGVEGSEAYETQRVRKIEGYRLHGLPLISIESHHFRSAVKTLAKRLATCLTLAPARVQRELF